MIIAFLAVFAALQVADIALTLHILAHGGRELNPVARWFMARLGRLGGLVAIKAVTALFVIGGALVAHAYAPTAAMAALALVCALYAYVVLHNLQQTNRP